MFMSRRVAAQRRHIDQPSMDATTTSAGLEPPSVTMETTKVDSQSADDGSSNDTATSTTTNTVKTTTLLHFHHLPTWRQDNAYILTSYRAESRSYVGSLRSIVSHVHNESVNIWTHLAGAVAFPLYGLWLWRVVHPRYESADAHDVLVFSCFFVGALLCLVLSAACHTLMNHSPEVARWGNKLDYAGIVCLIVGSYMPALYYGFYCDEALMLRYMMLIWFLGLCCMLAATLERFRTPVWRPIRASIFVALGLSGVVPVIHGLSKYGYETLERKMSLGWVVLQGALYIFGAFLYAYRWPERHYPRTFDILGSSHQLFHVCVLLAASCFLYGMAKAFDYHHTILAARCGTELGGFRKQFQGY